ncbi:MAG: ATP-binding cassette domain-containing protein [Planctomycetota bacterium]
MQAPSPPTAPAGGIRTAGLCKRFGAHTALEPLDLTVEPGSVTGLIGPNGSGKSTMMRCLIGLVAPTQGRVWVDGVPLTGDGLAIRRRATYAPGEMGVYREMKGQAHLDWFLRGRDRETRRRARELASELGLPLERKVGMYSHGMKRQLVFAAAMAPDVPVRILDEITEGLDPSKRTQVTDVLARESGRGTTVLLSSHHFGEVDRVCQRVLFMQAGRLLEDTSAAAMRDRAARILRVSYAQPTDAAAIEQRWPAALGPRCSRREHTLVFELPSQDPRAALEFLAAQAETPREVRFGAHTLADLYQDLYGVEGT